ncbi:tetratricopeptide repeat protein [Actinoallomurus iriomotensis]|uniref:NB-ARC domain-containing protein n=1 Tax=Actinoallomurus iriomotensis TaxID=478107 RepID=A0A9W6VRE5_9ACTN|nr:tetratricopeptide repeat protein [Actinoallomurus iriomotensis]GLY76884.1 hypothetical protein Airi01_051510 [Actinoallomurus iriomotensis]
MGRRRHVRTTVALWLGPVAGVTAGALTNLITARWNWWLFGGLIVLTTVIAASGALVAPPPPAPVAGSAPHLAPPLGTRVFTGRARELDRLCAAAPDDSGPLLLAVTGLGGTGKTELAVRAAARLAARCPDGRFWLGLRTYAPAESRMGTAEVLRTLLNALGVAPDPQDVDVSRLSAKWRSVTADRRILLVLDDVANADQVRPVLPTSADSIVLVTSRHLLIGLDPDDTVTLDVFTEAEARQLAAGILRRAGHDDVPTAAAIAAGYRLPLAVRQMADLKAADPHRAITDPPPGGGSGEADVAFSLSLAALGKDARSMLRRVARYPGSLITVAVAATMADLPPDRAQHLLSTLYQHGLLISAGPDGGYRMHDLIRAAATGDPSTRDDRRGLTEERLFRYVDAAIASAVETLYRSGSVTGLSSGRPARSAVPPPRHETDLHALTWLDRHHADLLAVARRCVAVGSPQAWRMVYDLEFYQRLRGFYGEIAELHTEALRLAEAARDRFGQAAMHHNLGLLDMRRTDFPAARAHFDISVARYAEVGSLVGEGEVRHELANIGYWLGDLPSARAHAEAALTLLTKAGDPVGVAFAHRDLGVVDRAQGRHADAADRFDTSIRLFESIGQRRGVAVGRRELALLLLEQGRHTTARRYLE